jgi:tetratricopeptide (TPR) repeat protein
MARLSYQGAYGLTASEATNADTLFARRRFGEARDAYQQSLKDDSMNARLHVMVGVASLAQGDYARAKTSLQRAYELLPPGGAQRDDLGLLLARADLLAGLPDEAKNRLRQLAQGTSDSSMKVAAQTAIVKIDSMESLNVPKLIPK